MHSYVRSCTSCRLRSRLQTDEGRPLRDKSDVDADCATTRAGQARPDYADHYNGRAHGSHVKGSDLDVLLSTDDADEWCLC